MSYFFGARKPKASARLEQAMAFIFVRVAILALLRALGAEISEGSGSRVRVRLGAGLAVFHRPHPRKEAKKSLVEAVRLFLSNNGITP